MSDTEYESEAEAEAEAEQSDDFFAGDATTKAAKAAVSGSPASPPFPWQGIFQMAKQMAISTLAMRVVKKLDPSKPGCVRIARIIYASYLVIYQIVLAYMRIKVSRENDQTEVVIPPPTKLLGTLSKAAGGGAAAADGPGSSGARPEAQQLEDMAAKLLTRKIPAKAYDMARIDTMRQQLVGTSIVMALLHLKMHMIKPIVLGAAMGLWTMLESPVFKIHVLGMKAQGRLQRPFTADASLNDWLKNKSDLAQKLQAEKEAAPAFAGEAIAPNGYPHRILGQVPGFQLGVQACDSAEGAGEGPVEYAPAAGGGVATTRRAAEQGLGALRHTPAGAAHPAVPQASRHGPSVGPGGPREGARGQGGLRGAPAAEHAALAHQRATRGQRWRHRQRRQQPPYADTPRGTVGPQLQRRARAGAERC